MERLQGSPSDLCLGVLPTWLRAMINEDSLIVANELAPDCSNLTIDQTPVIALQGL